MSSSIPLARVDGPLARTLPHPLPPSWYSKGCYLTRSMTLSRGASLTVSSLMAKIWSPGRSFPKEGPSADAVGHKVTYSTVKRKVYLKTSQDSLLSLYSLTLSLSPTYTYRLTSRDGAYDDRPLAARNEAEALSRVALDGDLSSWGRT